VVINCQLTRLALNHIIYLMTATATILYRTPQRVFSAADRGEKVIIRRGKSEYVLTKKSGTGALYGCLRGSIRRDLGKPKVRWKALR
jgi:hypothetical protein